MLTPAPFFLPDEVKRRLTILPEKLAEAEKKFVLEVLGSVSMELDSKVGSGLEIGKKRYRATKKLSIGIKKIQLGLLILEWSLRL